MPSSHLILCCPLHLLPPIPPSITVFSNESTLCMRWRKYWSFSLSISPSSEHPGLIFRMDWLDLLAVQGTLKSLLQHHSLKASILQRSAFFTVQLSHPYILLYYKSTAGIEITFLFFTFLIVYSIIHIYISLFSSIDLFPRSKSAFLFNFFSGPSCVTGEKSNFAHSGETVLKTNEQLLPNY